MERCAISETGSELRALVVVLTEASMASDYLCPDEASEASASVIPTTGANATGGGTSDSFAHAKPVPVSEIAQRSFVGADAHS
jgi:hypothetical protein